MEVTPTGRGNKVTAWGAVVILSLCISPAFAQSTDREKALESRVNYLEERLQKLEKTLDQSSRASVVQGSNVAPAPSVTTKRQGNSRPLPARAAQVAPPPSAQVATAPPAATPAATAVATEKSDDAPQELNVLRENSVTLQSRGIEISQDVNYTTRHTQLQRDQGFIANTSIRYGLLQWLELSATIPTGYTMRTTNVSADHAVRQTVSGVGDLVFQANARVIDQTENWPGTVVSLGVLAPTGANPYDFSQYSLNQPGFANTPNPENPLSYSYSRGAWGGHTNLELFKTVDPLILFMGFGVDFTAVQKFSGYRVDAGLRYNYNLGFSFALSEKTTLGFSVSGSYSPDLRVNNRKVFDSSTDPAIARLTVIQRVVKDVYLEPSVSFGMNPDGPDFALGLGGRVRF